MNALRRQLETFGQLHVLDFWDELDEHQQNRLAAQLAAIDFEALAALYAGRVAQPDWAALARRAKPPRALRAEQREAQARSAWGVTPSEARRRGEEALAAGQVGVLVVAGGQGSRLGFDHPKSMYPIGPLSGASLLQIHCEKVLAAAKRYKRRIPLYVMTSPVTHDETVDYIEQCDRFGLDADDLVLFCQGTMPAVDAATGKLLLQSKDSLFLSPDGHGGTVAALAKSGAIGHMQRRGVQRLFYLQVDNPLAPLCDPEFVGHHLAANSELTSLAVAKLDPNDKLGNFASIDEKLHVIEYSDFPADVAHRTGADGRLLFWAGSVAIHVLDVAFLERAIALGDVLPFHVALKKAPYLDRKGELVTPNTPNALKFERFIFDLLPHAKRPIVVEYREQDAFAPLKNAPGAPKDTPQYVQELLLSQAARWIEAAGGRVAPGVQVEISPLYALDEAEWAARGIEKTFETSVYLR